MLDTKKEHIAVTEANKLGMPIDRRGRHQLRPRHHRYVIPATTTPSVGRADVPRDL